VVLDKSWFASGNIREEVEARIIELAICSFSRANDLGWHLDSLIVNDPDTVRVRPEDIKDQIESHGLIASSET
jgi:hypothetical protein